MIAAMFSHIFAIFFGIACAQAAVFTEPCIRSSLPSGPLIIGGSDGLEECAIVTAPSTVLNFKCGGTLNVIEDTIWYISINGDLSLTVVAADEFYTFAITDKDKLVGVEITVQCAYCLSGQNCSVEFPSYTSKPISIDVIGELYSFPAHDNRCIIIFVLYSQVNCHKCGVPPPSCIVCIIDECSYFCAENVPQLKSAFASVTDLSVVLYWLPLSDIPSGLANYPISYRISVTTSLKDIPVHFDFVTSDTQLTIRSCELQERLLIQPYTWSIATVVEGIASDDRTFSDFQFSRCKLTLTVIIYYQKYVLHVD